MTEHRSSLRSPRRAILAAVVVSVVVACSVGAGLWWWLSRAALQQPDLDEIGWMHYQLPDTVAGQSYSFAGVTTVCTEGGPDPVTITDVQLLDPVGSVSLVAYSVAAVDDSFPAASEGVIPDTLRSIGWPTDQPVQVRARCAGETGAATAAEVLGIELRKAKAASAGASGLRIHWTSGLRRGTVTYPYAIVLCESSEKTCPDLLPR